MFLPIGDDNRDRILTPWVNYLFIIVNLLVFIFYQQVGHNIYFTYAFATVPAEIITGTDIVTQAQTIQDPVTGQILNMPGLQPTPVPVFFTLIISMFMHGGWAHIGGNMLFLWVFGDNLEDAMGHKRYFFFYLLCGVISGLAHVFSTLYFGMNPYIPSLGASGAISGVLGGYILLFPHKRVHVWILWFIISVPAFITLGIWIIFQVVNGMGALGGQNSSDIAYAAHIGGFVAGLILVKLFQKRKKPLPVKAKSFW